MAQHILPPLLTGPTQACWITHEFGGDDTPNQTEKYEGNQEARMKIVQALGGGEAVGAIPRIAYPILVEPNYLEKVCRRVSSDPKAPAERIMLPATGHMNELEKVQFPPNTSILQTEDPAGRKAVVVWLVDKRTGQLRVEVIFQRYRETCIMPPCVQDGRTWLSKVLVPNGDGNVEPVAAALAQVIQGVHPRWALRA